MSEGQALRVAIVDDEPLARARLRALVGELGDVTLVGEAGNGVEALALVAREQPHVVLLDIRMPVMDGLETAQHLARQDPAPAVVFVTAYEDHALAAFEAQAVDYLLKPVRAGRLVRALDKARALTATRAGALAQALGSGRTHLAARVGNNLYAVPVAEVRYLVAEHKYVSVGWPEGEVVVEESLRQLEEEFAGRFLRVHRNALVAREHVAALERVGVGHEVVMRGVQRRLPVSRRLLSTVRRRLREGS